MALTESPLLTLTKEFSGVVAGHTATERQAFTHSSPAATGSSLVLQESCCSEDQPSTNKQTDKLSYMALFGTKRQWAENRLWGLWQGGCLLEGYVEEFVKFSHLPRSTGPRPEPACPECTPPEHTPEPVPPEHPPLTSPLGLPSISSSQSGGMWTTQMRIVLSLHYADLGATSGCPPRTSASGCLVRIRVHRHEAPCRNDATLPRKSGLF
ncbi:hypothetical protein Q8A67_020633 [Cirrhinus molitorella]|uniref:Uncharacterized protein n=1 Tax=Cirrhinus molitorella TaxID=172907 RepID=A0AA88P836_9TELE|nr:hypothetical protein Q8A67_020633 [Cirrhinus molitorella]